MKPIVAILGQGGMGAAIGQRLFAHGLVVRTPLEGRSEASVSRARDAGMIGGSLDEIAACDIILSIVPPADALAAAERMVPALAEADRKPLFVECNAINPGTLKAIAAVIEPTSTPFVDSGIIGLPPKPGGNSPKFFACGPEVARFKALGEYGLDVRVVDGPLGAASTLKMSYGGITKGVIAVGAAMVLAAIRNGAGKALFDELSASQANLIASYAKSLPDMLPKAGRWVAEMEEISAFVGDGSPEADIYAAFGEFYSRIAANGGDASDEAAAILGFFKQ